MQTENDMRSLLVITALAILATTTHGASAADAGFCNGYVAIALDNVERWRKNGCGPVDQEPMWSTDPAVHRGWCEQASQDSVEEGRGRRVHMVRECECTRYAETAVAQNSRNLKKGCGYTGPEWNGDLTGHHDWCTGIRAGEEVGETEQRERLLGQCGG
jgi:hypothetical protein